MKDPNNKTIYFYKFNTLVFFISIFYKINGYQVKYFRFGNFNRNLLFKKILKEYFKIVEVNYEDYKCTNIDEYMDIENYFIDIYFKRKEIQDSKDLISSKFFDNENTTIILIKKLFAFEYNDFFKTLHLILEDKRNGSNSILYYFDDDFINYVLNYYPDINFKKSYLNATTLFYIENLFKILIKLISSIRFKITTLLKNKNNLINLNKNIINDNYNKKYLYFPHKGIYYGDKEFLKDQFFSYDSNSDLHHSNFLFLGLDNNDINDDNTKYFYKANNIQYLNLFKYFGKSYSSKKVFELLLKNHSIKNFSMNIKARIMISYLKKLYYTTILNKFKQVEYIFIGYDILFPIELCLSARLLKIKTVSNQERLSLVFNPEFKLIIDYYFVITKSTEKFISKNDQNFSIKKLFYIGSMRVQNLYEELFKNNNNYLTNKLNNKKFKYICAVFDWHSEISFDENIKKRTNNWKNNKIFYEIILNLSYENRNVLFIIKSKNYNYMNNAFLSKTILKLKQRPNIKFANISNDITSYKLISISHFSICRYTTLCEEMNYFNFPYVVFDDIGYLNKVKQLTSLPLSKNEIEIKKWIKNILDQDLVFNKDRMQFYSSNVYETKHNLRKVLKDMLINKINY